MWNRKATWRACLVTLLLSFTVFAIVRWPGPLPPYGSDTDEHLLVARALVERGAFDVGGLHATKYPPGISLIAAAVLWAGGTPGYWLVAFNILCLLLSALLIFRFVGEASGPFSGLVAALFLAANPTTWSSVHEVKGDVPFLLIVTLALGLAVQLSRSTWSTGGVICAVLLATLAVLTRTVGLVVGGTLFIALLTGPSPHGMRLRVAFASSVLVLPSLIVVIAILANRDLPPHPTGYVETFVLRDPYDAASGSFGLSDVPNRVVRGLYAYGADTASALAGSSFNRYVAAGVAAALLLVPLASGGARAVSIIAYLISYSLLIVMWPYRSPRFAIPLVPIAALGLGALVARASSMRRGARAFLMALFLCHLANGLVELRREGRQESKTRLKMHRDLNDLHAWSAEPEQRKANLSSFDYRALMWRLRRVVVPLRYTSDAEFHLRTLCESQATHLVVSSAIYPLRGRYAASLLRALDSPELIHENETFRVYRIPAACDAYQRAVSQRATGSGGG